MSGDSSRSNSPPPLSPQTVRHEVLLVPSLAAVDDGAPPNDGGRIGSEMDGARGSDSHHSLDYSFPPVATAAVVPGPSSTLQSHHRLTNAADWQTTKCRVAERGRHLFETGIWSDCEFIVGLPPNIKVFHGHKMFLAMSSPVFEAMFFGCLAETRREIKILDVQPDAFAALLEYIYTDKMRLTSFELVCDICYAAKKYMLPDLVEECTKYLWRDLYPRNACRAYEFAKLFEEPILLDKSLQIISSETVEVLSESTWEEVEHSTLVTVLSKDSLSAPESLLFEALLRWAVRECERRGVEPTAERKRAAVGEALFLIRYLSLTAAEFAAGPAQSGLLTQQESFALLMNISCPSSWKVPEYFSTNAETRKFPELHSLQGAVDTGTKYWCKRAMMQEPHCLNTSILDCSVTFTVDRDVYIHGIEVPSQVTDIPVSQQVEGIPVVPHSSNGYNELLYAHLLDNEGARLTYTHFTSKVNWNSMIEISFNRAVLIQANKVYRIGMVLNKVGWYPMGVCTRRVQCENCFFTFCVGQPNDTLRDGLIRSIIFSR